MNCDNCYNCPLSWDCEVAIADQKDYENDYGLSTECWYDGEYYK